MNDRTRSLRRRARVAAICTLFALVIADAPATSAGGDETATEIIDEMIDRDPLGYGGAEARILMALVNSRGQEQKRKVVLYSRNDGDTRRMFVRFLSPSDVAGTAFVGVDKNGKRRQHLYLPELAKVRRISGRKRNAAFVGTDYSYADMDLRDIDDSKKKRLDDDKIGGQSCFVVEATPDSDDSAYAKVHLWISKKTYLPLRIRFYDEDDNEIKRLTVKEVKKVDGRWIISESKMVDLKGEHTTIMKVTEIELRDDIPLDQFTVRALERG